MKSARVFVERSVLVLLFFSAAAGASFGEKRARAVRPRPLAPIGNSVVNDPLADTTAQDTQSEAAIVLGGGTNVIVAYNDSAVFNGSNNHFLSWSRSGDGGGSWNPQGTLPDGLPGDRFHPVLARDATSGVTYLSSLTYGAMDSIAVFRSADDGASWQPAVDGTPGIAGTGDVMDKEWIAVDNFAGGGQGSVYLVARDDSSAAGGARDGILFFRSTDGGATWGPSGGTRLDGNTTSSTQGAFVMVGPDHSVDAFWNDYSGGAVTIRMRRSTDGGSSFGSESTVAVLNSTTLDLGLNDGMFTDSYVQGVVNPVSGDLYLAFTDAIVVDPTLGLVQGNVYLTQSSDGGATWTTPAIVSDDASGNDHWHPSIAVTPDGTHLFLSWYDSRLDPSDFLIDRFGVIGDATASPAALGANFKITTQSFPPAYGQDPSVDPLYMGDYDQAAADDNFFYTVWGDNRNNDAAHFNEPDVFFAKIPVRGPGAIILPAGSALVEENCLPANGAVDPGETVAVSLSVQNLGPTDTTNLVATLEATGGVTSPSAPADYGVVAALGAPVARTFTFTANGTCGGTLTATLDLQDGPYNLGTVTFTFTLGATINSTASFVNIAPIAINDGTTATPYPSTVSVSNLLNTVRQVTVTLLNFSHQAPGDVDVLLVGPQGQKVIVLSDVGGSHNVNNISFTLSDTAGRRFSRNGKMHAGTYKPTNYGGGDVFPSPAPGGPYSAALNVFNGTDPNGTWSLYVVDDTANGKTGAINGGWRLNITTGVPSCCTSTCPPISISPLALLNGAVGASYGQTLTAAGGTGPYTFAVGSGALPGGTTLSPAGVLSGTLTAAGSFNFTVTATDANGCQGIRAYTVSVSCSPLTLLPGALPGGTAGSPYSQSITATGATGTASFAVTSGSLPTGLTLAASGLLSGTPSAPGTFTFTVTATDSVGCTGSHLYRITIGCPAITISPATLPPGDPGTPYSQSIAGSGGSAPYTYSFGGGILPPGLTLNPATGAITGTPTTAGSYSFTAVATDADGCQGFHSYTINIGNTCGNFTLSPASLPAGTAGASYSQQITASGGTGPYTFAVTFGTLPPGLTLDPAGLLSGTPTASGTYNFTVTATDSAGCTGGMAYTLGVSCAAITVNPASLPGATVGVTYTQNLSASGGTGSYGFAVTSGALPTGLTLSAAGVLTGTPSVSGTFAFTVTATDVNGCTGSRDYTLGVSCPTITLSPPSLPAGSVGVPYSQTITASGGQAPYAFIASGGPLPPGLTLSASGTISGTPTAAGSYSFTVTATDVDGCTGIFSYTINVDNTCPVITLSPPVLPGGSVGMFYSQTITPGGGVGPYTLVVTAGALPTGLTLDVAGLVSGTPTAAGTYNFTITATDSNGCTGGVAYTVVISPSSCPIIDLNPSGLPDGVVGAAYSQTVTASGGAGPYTYAVTSGALPPGLSLDGATGALTGVPGVMGTFNFTITATDSSGCSGSQPYVLNIIVLTITPPCGDSAGGTPVVIFGANFQPGATVTIAGLPATGVVVVSSTEIDAVTPANAPGTVGDVVVTNPDLTTETLTDGFGYDFLDVPAANPFHNFVCAIERHRITAGCGAGDYCPVNSVVRSQMAVFILRGEHGSAYVPPAAVGIFADVPVSNPFAPWIEQLYNEGITGGCGTNPLIYCPANPVTRAQMAVFLLIGEHGPGYVPPACTGIFTDVACPGPFTNFIEQLYNEGITAGCNTNPLQYCPGNSVVRAQMAVFLKVTFNLQ